MSTRTTKPRRKKTTTVLQTAKSGLPSGDTGSSVESSVPHNHDGERVTVPQQPRDSGLHTLELTLEALSVDHETAERIQKLPHDIGWLLVTAGVVGVVMPGVLGVPFLVLGGLILMPGTNRRAERWLTGHSPKVFKGSVRQVNRFLDDLERRYPRVRKK